MRIEFGCSLFWLVFIGGLIIATLSACATTAPPSSMVARATSLDPQKEAVITPCLKREKVPDPPSSWMRSDKSGEYNELAARIDLKELDEYMVKSQSLLWGCVQSFEAKE